MSPERGGGVFVAVVGPSGAGKDTLMSHAARHPGMHPDVRFARRIVTRAVQPDLEDHESVDDAAFAVAEASGAFCLTWAAHGLRYALPRSLQADVDAGGTIVANLSRRSLGDAVAAFGSIAVVEVTARPEILLDRLSRRGREDEAAIRDRLRREATLALPAHSAYHLKIDNSGEVAAATDLLVHHLNHLRRSR